MDTLELIHQAKLIRSKRKTLCIQFREDGLVIKAPIKASNRLIQQFLADQQQWVIKQLLKREKQKQQQLNIVDGCYFSYLGRSLCLKVTDDIHSSHIQQNLLFLKYRETNSKLSLSQTFQAWLKQQAGAYIQENAKYQAEKIGVLNRISSFRFSKTKSKWGSCSPDGKLQFNWLIMLAPVEIVDYLVCHEVCHLVHLNHSPAFWQLVAQLHPEFKQSRSWLKNNGHSIWIN